MIILLFIFLVALLFVSAIQPKRSEFSIFELERRSKIGDSEAKNILEREVLMGDILSLQRVITALLLVLTVLISVGTFGWLVGVIFAIVVALEYGAISRFKLIRSLTAKGYDYIEIYVLKFIKRYPIVFKFLRSVPVNLWQDNTQKINSREELQHMISESGNTLTSDEKKLIVSGLTFADRTVESVMTPRSMINSIEKSEFLGPLILNDLHKLGHSRLPVFDGDIDHVVGILHIKDLLTLDIKKSAPAEKVMEPKVYYIRQDQTLKHALTAFIRTRHHLFIVVNEYRETVGLLSLEDVIESLIGTKIIDEFDAHDDLRAVALRNPRGNNHPEKREDV